MAAEGDVPLDDKAKRMRDLLSSFYSPDPSVSSDASSKSASLDAINTTSFDADQYMNLLVLYSFFPLGPIRMPRSFVMIWCGESFILAGGSIWFGTAVIEAPCAVWLLRRRVVCWLNGVGIVICGVRNSFSLRKFRLGFLLSVFRGGVCNSEVLTFPES